MPDNTRWSKSSYSDNGANCVEVAFVPGGVLTRDSKDPDGPTLTFDRTWNSFLTKLKAGHYQP